MGNDDFPYTGFPGCQDYFFPFFSTDVARSYSHIRFGSQLQDFDDRWKEIPVCIQQI